MIFACIMDYVSDKDRLAAVRPTHRLYMRKLIEDGRVVAAGSFAHPDDGGLFLYRAATFEEAEGMVIDDPYVREGIGTWRLREYEVHGANPDLLQGDVPNKTSTSG